MEIKQLYIPAVAILLVALFSNTPKNNVVSANQPNVILIMLDDVGYGDIQAHGNPYLKTPHLDRLHEESVRFTNFHVDPSCSPSRAAILTGQYSSRSGVWHTIGGRSLLQKDKLAAHFDILPTLVDLAGLEVPENVKFDGLSLRSLIHNPRVDWADRTLFIHNQRLQYPEKYKDFQVLTEKWRLEGREKKELYDIKKDPGQKFDIANKHKDVVDSLTKKYEYWWQDISVDFELYNNIIIGNEKENPSLIYAHDALRSEEGLVWAIDVEKEGMYEFTIYRWPLESGRRIVENEGATFRHNMPPTSNIETNRFRIENGDTEEEAQINKARLAIGNLEKEVAVTNAMTSSTFTVQLKAGETALKAWFSGDKKYGANYLKIHYIGPAVFNNRTAYEAVHPYKWLRNK
ncbi:MAG: sulfatase-like hydrolase/transferase [Cyclobacteriaceae bacterium]